MSKPQPRGRAVPKRRRRMGGAIPVRCPSGKRGYMNRHQAVLAARSTQGKYATRSLRIYRCERLPQGITGEPCGQYHMTSSTWRKPPDAPEAQP